MHAADRVWLVRAYDVGGLVVPCRWITCFVSVLSLDEASLLWDLMERAARGCTRLSTCKRVAQLSAERTCDSASIQAHHCSCGKQSRTYWQTYIIIHSISYIFF